MKPLSETHLRSLYQRDIEIVSTRETLRGDGNSGEEHYLRGPDEASLREVPGKPLPERHRDSFYQRDNKRRRKFRKRALSERPRRGVSQRGTGEKCEFRKIPLFERLRRDLYQEGTEEAYIREVPNVTLPEKSRGSVFQRGARDRRDFGRERYLRGPEEVFVRERLLSERHKRGLYQRGVDFGKDHCQKRPRCLLACHLGEFCDVCIDEPSQRGTRAFSIRQIPRRPLSEKHRGEA